jgi:hypothetical protein
VGGRIVHAERNRVELPRGALLEGEPPETVGRQEFVEQRLQLKQLAARQALWSVLLPVVIGVQIETSSSSFTAVSMPPIAA